EDRDAGSQAGALDGLPVAVLVVESAGHALGVRLALLGTLTGGTVGLHRLLMKSLGCLARREQRRVGIGLEPGQEDLLGTRAQDNLPLAIVVHRLVQRRSIEPLFPGAVDLARRHAPDFAGPHPGVPLQADHGTDRRADVAQDGLDVLLWDRPDFA